MKEFTMTLQDIASPAPVKRVKEAMPPCWFCGSARSKRKPTLSGVQCESERGCFARAFKKDTGR